jgi:hypothetical protein
MRFRVDVLFHFGKLRAVSGRWKCRAIRQGWSSLIRNLAGPSVFGTQRVIMEGKTQIRRQKREALQPEQEWDLNTRYRSQKRNA